MTAIHDAIIGAMSDIAKTGIAKLGRNKDQSYNFRGVEQAMNEMSPILIRRSISVTSSYSDLAIHERESKSGTKMRFATLKGSFKFEAEDGSCVVGEAFGEGMDSSDKATAKAMSVAFRTALFQQFVVPTMAVDTELNGEDDGDEPAAEALAAAESGMAAYQAYWKALDAKGRKALEKHHAELKAIATEADAVPQS